MPCRSRWCGCSACRPPGSRRPANRTCAPTTTGSRTGRRPTSTSRSTRSTSSWRGRRTSTSGDDFQFGFVPLWQLDEAGRADVADKITRTVAEAVREGIVDNRGTALEELKRASRVTGIWGSITDEDIEDAKAAPPIGGEGGDEPSDPGDEPPPTLSPQHAHPAASTRPGSGGDRERDAAPAGAPRRLRALAPPARTPYRYPGPRLLGPRPGPRRGDRDPARYVPVTVADPPAGALRAPARHAGRGRRGGRLLRRPRARRRPRRLGHRPGAPAHRRLRRGQGHAGLPHAHPRPGPLRAVLRRRRGIAARRGGYPSFRARPSPLGRRRAGPRCRAPRTCGDRNRDLDQRSPRG